METFIVENIKFRDIDFTDPKLLSQDSYKYRRSSIFLEFTNKYLNHVDIQRAMQAGATGLKFKSGYTTKQEKSDFLAQVEKARQWYQEYHNMEHSSISTCVTLKTCMVKTGLLEDGVETVDILEGSEIILTNHSHYVDKCNSRRIFIDNPHLTIEMKRGMEVNIAQAEIVMEVIDVHETGRSVKCKCTRGGKLRSMVTVSVRNMTHTRPYLTKKDLQMLKFAVDFQIDIIVINYVRHVETITKAKHFLTGYIGDRSSRPIILAGICTLVGLENIDSLLKHCDGLIIARDYLPYELPKHMENRLPMLQKYIGAKCLQAGKPYLISGAVLLQLVDTGEVTNSEVADVSNSLLDGATGFMIKDCVDIDNTLAAIGICNRVCQYTEPLTGGKTMFWDMVKKIPMPLNAAEAAVMSAIIATNMTQSRVLVLPTVTGRTVKAVLRMRPSSIIIAISTNIRIIRLLHTLRGVVALYYNTKVYHQKFHQAVQARIDYGVEYAVSQAWLKQGDTYVSMQRSTEAGIFCDMVRIFATIISKKVNVECPSVYDFEKKKESTASAGARRSRSKSLSSSQPGARRSKSSSSSQPGKGPLPVKGLPQPTIKE